MTIIISPDLRSLIPPLTPEELAQLEANLLAEGCRDPLITWRWQGEEILLDGHNRHDLCERHGLPYRTQELSLPDLDAAKAWMIANQLGRRNLTPEQMSYYRGEQYNLQKQQGKRTDLTSGNSYQKSHNTATQLAQQHQVSEKTIRNDAVFAQAVDTLVEAVGPEVRQTILARETKVTQQDVKSLAQVATTSAPKVREALAAVQEAKTTKQAREIVQALVLEAEAPAADATPPAAPSPVARRAYTGDAEWYTPPEVVALVRQVLGTIDVDPASCADAQAVVQATTFYTLHDDGLRQPWSGTVFLNPPYTMPDIARFVGKLCEEIEAQHTTAAIQLVNAATDTDWFQRVATLADVLCFTDGRIRFVHATRTGESPCQGQAVLYFGPHVEHFCAVFAALGLLMQMVRAKAAGPQLTLAEAPAPAPAAAPKKRPILKRKAAKKRAPVKRKAKV